MTALLAAVAGAFGAAGLAMLLPPRRAAGAMALLARAGARLRTGGRPPAGLADKIAAAGSPPGLGPREVIGAKLAAAAAAGVLSLPLGAALPGRLGLATALGAPVVGFLGPDAWLARRARERFRAAQQELPVMLDLLRVAVEAGAPLAAALSRVGEGSRGTVAAEWRRIGREAALGVSLEESLAAMNVRLPCPEIESLVSALARATRHGAPLSDTLAAQSRDARHARRRRIQEEAARAAPKIQLVVALLLVPSVMLLIAAALLGALLRAG